MQILRPLMLVFTGVILSIVLYAQTPSYHHYTTADGLASSTVFEIIQDKEGLIWLATLNGISRFDGQQFTTYRTEDGLNSNSIISMAEGSSGEIYIGNYEEGINVLKNGKIKNFHSEFNGRRIRVAYLHLDSSDTEDTKLYAYTGQTALYVFPEKKSGNKPYTLDFKPHYLIKVENLPTGEKVALTTGGLFIIRNDSIVRLQISGLNDTTAYCLSSAYDSSYYIGAKEMIYKIKHGKVIRRYKVNLFNDDNKVVKILCDRNDNIWFSIMNKGFFYIATGSDKIIDIGSKMGLGTTLVNNYLEDSEGNIWLSTYGKGVFCLYNLYLKSYSENDGLSSNSIQSLIKAGTTKLLIGTFNGLNVLENGVFNQVEINSQNPSTDYIYNIKEFDDEFYVCVSLGSNEIINTTYKGLNLYMFTYLSFCKTDAGLYLFGTILNTIATQKEMSNWMIPFSISTVFGDSLINNRVNEIVEDSEHNIWIATGLGLCRASLFLNEAGKTELKKSFFPEYPVLNAGINAILQDKAHNVWFAGKKGIAKYNIKHDSVVSYTSVSGHDFSASTSLASDSKNRIWIGNMKGLYLLEYNSVKYLNQQTGLPSNEVLSLFYDSTNNSLLIGTSNGMSILDVDNFDQYQAVAPKVIITEVKAGDSTYTNYNNLIFKPEQHDISIDFQAIHFSSPGSVTYMYRLDNNWLTTDFSSLNFISLKNGTYNLQIMAKAQNTLWSKPYVLSFRVLPRFIETIWFYLLMIFLLLTTGPSILMLSLKLNKIKANKELALTERINELKHQALSAMMNPHFIANSLNSVQYLVNSRKYEDANNYIAMMAKLMRKNLDTAGKGFIRLSDEIDRLKLYLDIEKLRFQESFTYEIIIGVELDTNTVLIPNMIIQPFVENSLWHGIINSGNSGLLTVAFTFENVDIDSVIGRSLIIRVTDNGIGINEARKHKKEDHISKGIQIIEERLRLLSTKMNLTQPIVFEDLSGTDPDAHGTEVIISLPPPLYKVTNHSSDPSTTVTV